MQLLVIKIYSLFFVSFIFFEFLSYIFFNMETVVALEDCSLWNTSGKSYDQWLCPLVHSLIGHTDDVILRYSIFCLRNNICL